MSYQIGLCDDEVYQIKVNSIFLKEIAKQNKYDLQYHGFQSGKQVKKYLQSNHLDILFLDIDLGEESGIEVAAWVNANYPDVRIIFVTGHRDFAEEAFEVDATGYLVKPYDIKKMENAMKKALQQIEKKPLSEDEDTIVITDENIKKKIELSDILYIERQQSKSIIRTRQKEYQVYETITSLCERLGNSFIRINQGEVVNRSLISEIKGNTVYLKNGTEMTIGRTYKKEVKDKYFGTN